MTDWTRELTKIAIDIIAEGKHQIDLNNSNASGRLSDSLDYYVRNNVIEISALQYGDFLDTGTGPRKGGNGPGFFDSIKEWVAYKNIDPSAAWPIYKTILEKGTQKHPWVWRMERYALDKVSSKALDFLSTLVNDKISLKFERIWT
jgi:hypothetical protein